MLTLKAPIRISPRPSMLRYHDDLSRKIDANYQIMASSLSPESMLHFMTDAAEIYMEGDTMTSLVAVSHSTNRQHINVELVNNVLNRILVSEESTLTYQDRTFIDMVLKRIGITDVKQFMHQVSIAKHNTESINHLLRLYEQGGDVIEELRQYFKNIRLKQEKNDAGITKWEDNRQYHNQQQYPVYRTDIESSRQLLEYRQEGDDIKETLQEYMEESHSYHKEQATNVLEENREQLQTLEQDIRIQNQQLVQQESTVTQHIQNAEQSIQQLTRQLKQEEHYTENYVQAQHNTQLYQQTEHELWLHQNILNRLETGAIYQEIENYYRPVQNLHQAIDERELMISEQLMQAQNISLNQLKNQISYRNEPLEYRMINTYELGDSNRYYTQEGNITGELVEAVMLNAINHAYSLRHEQLQEKTDTWYDLTESIRLSLDNTMNRFEQIHGRAAVTYKEADVYNRTMQDNITNEITALEKLYEQHQENRSYQEQNIEEQQLVYQDETTQHGQQINYLTQQEELLKQQLNEISLANQQKKERLEHIVERLKPEPILQINRAKAMEDARRAIEEPQKVILEYLRQENTLEQYETTRQEQLSKVVDKDVLKLFEQIEQYHNNPAQLPQNVIINNNALESLIHDTTMQTAARNQETPAQAQEKTQELIGHTTSEEVRNRLERIITKETPKISYQQMPSELELLHRTTQTGVNEELLEEIRSVNRTVSKSTQQYNEEIQDTQDIYRSVTNHVNRIELQNNEEISSAIANQVRDQLGSLSEQVYRRLEKRMDTEKRRRGL